MINTNALDPRTPVIVGVGQHVQRPADVAEAREAVELMAIAAEAAADDAGARGLLSRVDPVTVVKGAWRYSNPAQLVADRIGARRARSALTHDGGNTPQSIVSILATRIAAGDLDVALLVGAETIWSRRRARARGIERRTTAQDDSKPDELLGDGLPMGTELEWDQGIRAPIHTYPIFETALRHDRGEGIAEHMVRVSELWARFNAVAVQNPYAWLRTPMTAEEIRTPTASNRLVNYPYTKSLNSNWDLDQAAAVILCSAEAASAAGIATDRWVFPHASAEAHDTPFLSNRADLHSSPAIRFAAARARELSGHGVDDLTHVDVYSCFPSAVQIAAGEIGLDESRPLTVTGGLSFAGGPLNNYVTHSIATMTGRLRADPAAVGLITANGGHLTKHAIGVYAADPPRHGFRAEHVQAEVDRMPTREGVSDHDGPVTVEAYTVMHDHDGPERALFATLLADGRRAWGHSTDRDTMDLVMRVDAVGTPAHRMATGVVSLD